MNELQKPLSALIVGASGLTGSFLLPLLLKEERYEKVIALSRKPLPFQQEKLKTILTDGKNLGELSENLQASHIFCCLGTTMAKARSKQAFEAIDLEYPLQLAEICRKNGASHFLLISALGADPHSGIYYSRIKGIVEEKIIALNYPRTTIFRPSILDGPRKENRMGEKIGLKIAQWMSPLLQGPWKKYRPTKVSELAERMAVEAWSEQEGVQIIEGLAASQIQANPKGI